MKGEELVAAMVKPHELSVALQFELALAAAKQTAEEKQKEIRFVGINSTIWEPLFEQLILAATQEDIAMKLLRNFRGVSLIMFFLTAEARARGSTGEFFLFLDDHMQVVYSV